MKNLFLICLMLASFDVYGKEDSTKFHEITRWQLGGDGGWDYLTTDSSTRRLYIARNNRIMVVDLDSGKLLDEVPSTEGAHGVALVPSLGLGFGSAGRSGTITVFDLKTLKKVDEIKVGQNPDALLYDNYSGQIFVFNGKSKSVSVIDPKSKKVVATMSLPGKPEFSASNEKGLVFVNIEDQNKIVSINSKENKIVGEYPLAPCDEPTGLSINSSHDRLYVGCGNKMAVVFDLGSKKVIKTIPAGKGIDATAFDTKLNMAFVSAGEGRLTVISESPTVHVVQDLETVKGARTLALDSVKGHVLLATAKFGPPQEKAGRPSVLPNSFYIIVLGQ